MVKISKNTIKLLSVFYSNPGRQFYIQELGRILKRKPGVFQRVLYKLEKENVLKSEYKANARFFWANRDYPIYQELKSIISKSSLMSLVILFIVFSMAGLFVVFAQDISSTDTLTLNSLKDAISIAYKNNKDIGIQEQEIKVSKANILGARSEFLPGVNFDASYTRNGAVMPVSTTATLKKDYGIFAGYKNDNRVGISVGQIIYNGGANIANLRQSQVALKEQEETLRATKLNVELQAKQLYYGLLLAYETKRIAEDLVNQAQQHYENVKHYFQQGTASKFDVLQSKVQVSLVMPQLVSARNAISFIAAELNQLLGLKVQQNIVVTEKLFHSTIKINEAEFLKQSYLNKPEMILQTLGIDMSKWQIKFAKAGWLPQINASADYNFRSGNTANMFNDRHNNWSLGVAMSIPIFDGFATKAKVDAAKAKYAESLLSKENVSDLIAVSVRKDCLDLVQQQAIIDSQTDNLEDAREALRISEVRFANGIGINLDVLDAQVSLAQVEENLAQATYDYIMAKADLERNMGTEYLNLPGGEIKSLPIGVRLLSEAGGKQEKKNEK